jgi:hypothetical protein
MANYIVYHGVKLAENSKVYNLEVEDILSDPSPIRIGRIWYNRTDRHFKYTSLDDNNGIIIKTFACLEDISPAILEAHNINYPGYSSTTFTIPPNSNLETSLNLIIDEIVNIKQSLQNNFFLEEFYVTEPVVGNNILLSKDIINRNRLIILINGLEQPLLSVTIQPDNKTLHFTEDLNIGDYIKVVYFNNF